MKNFEFEIDGKKYWYSRSVAVVGIIQARDLNWCWHVLANKRGKNTPDYQGKWCLPCGYVDFDETCEEALKREVYEETGVLININNINLIGIDSEVSDPRQNITIRYNCNLDSNIEKIKTTDKYSDVGEVEDIKFIKISDINNYEWAFNHKNLLSLISCLENK